MPLPTNFNALDPLPHTDWNEFCATINNNKILLDTAVTTSQATQSNTAVVQTVANSNQSAILTIQQTLATRTAAITTLQTQLTSIQNRLTVLETVAPPPPVPNAPTGLVSGTITNTTVPLSVTPPVGGATPTGYTFRYAAAGTGAWITGPSGPGTSGTVTGLTPGSTYDFQCFAFNAAGPGPATATLTRTTTVPFTPSPAWTEMPPSTSIVRDDGAVVTLVGGVVQLGGTPLGHSSSVILVLKSDTGLIYQESNDPALADLPGGVGWWYWDIPQGSWIFSSDPRAVTPPSGTGYRNPNTIPYASTSVWNIGIGSGATWASAGAAETTTLRTLVLDVKTNSYGQPLFFGSPSDPLVTFQCAGQGTQSNVPWTRQRRIPANAQPSGGTDRHLNLIDSSFPLEMLSMWNCQCAQFGNLQNGSVITSGLGGVIDLTKNGLVGSEYPAPGSGGWSANAVAEYIGTDNFFGGTITQYDIAQGVIQHMLRCAISMAQLLSPNAVDGSNVNVEWPNTDVDYYHHSGNYAGNIPVGTYGIPATVNVAALGLSAGGLMLAHCLQDYGMVWRDQGGVPPAISLYSVPELAGNARIAEMNAAWNTIRPNVFRMTNQSASNVNGGGTRRVALLAPVGIGSPPPAVNASRIADLVELFGFNTFSSMTTGANLWGSYPADYLPFHVIAQHAWLTNNSGFALRGREYHYSDRTAMQATWLHQVVAATGMRFAMCVGAHGSADSQATMLDEVVSMQTLASVPANGIAWIEGNNEPNTDFGGGQVSAANTRAVQDAVSTGRVTRTVWDAAHASPNLTVTSNGLTCNMGTFGSGSDQVAYAGGGVTTGKYYWEVALVLGGSGIVGVGNTSSPSSAANYVGISAAEVGWVTDGRVINNTNTIATWGAYSGTARICVALDMTNHKLWMRLGTTGNWNNAVIGSQNPATNLGGITLPSTVYANPVVPAANLKTNGDSMTLVAAQASWAGLAPAGFGSLDAGLPASIAMGPSIVFGLPFPEGYITPPYISGADLTAVRATMTLANGHFYPPTLCDLDDGSNRNGAFDDVVTGLGLVYSKTVSITEFHPSLYASNTSQRPGGVNWNPTLDGYYTLIALLSAHRLGVDGLWWYSLDDYGTVYTSGLFPINEANPRPAAWMIRSLCTVTRDTGATKRTFTPASISYSISNLPAPVNAASPHTGGHHRAFRSSDGRGFVFVWNAQVTMGGTSVAVPLVFGNTYTTIREFNVSLGTAAGMTAVQTLSGASTITVQLNASVRVIELVP